MILHIIFQDCPLYQIFIWEYCPPRRCDTVHVLFYCIWLCFLSLYTCIFIWFKLKHFRNAVQHELMSHFVIARRSFLNAVTTRMIIVLNHLMSQWPTHSCHRTIPRMMTVHSKSQWHLLFALSTGLRTKFWDLFMVWFFFYMIS
jgi:hypothetical protein